MRLRRTVFHGEISCGHNTVLTRALQGLKDGAHSSIATVTGARYRDRAWSDRGSACTLCLHCGVGFIQLGPGG